MALSLTQTALVRVTAGQAVTNNLLRLLALSPSVSISGSVGTSDLAAGAVTAAKATPGAYFFTTTAGTANTYTLSLNPALAALADGALVVFKINATNTGPSTLNVNSLGAVALTRNGADLLAGDLIINRCYMAVYSSTGPIWDVVSQVGNLALRYAVATGTSPNYIFTTSGTGYAAPTSTSAIRGEPITFRANFTNDGPATLAVDALGTFPIEYPGHRALSGGEINVGDTVTVQWNSIHNAWMLLSISAVVPPAIVAASRNLVIVNGASPNSQMTITADEVVLKSTSGASYVASSVNVTADIALGVMPNGLDAGTETADAWYYLWLIYNSSAVASLISTSATTPTLPTGYTYKALVGMVRNAGSNFIVTRIQDRRVWQVTQDIAATITGVTSYTALTGTPATDFAKFVPPNAKTAFVILGKVANADYAAAVASDTSGTFEQIQSGSGTATAFNGMAGFSFFEVPLITPQMFSWKVDATTANGFKLQTTGYTF